MGVSPSQPNPEDGPGLPVNPHDFAALLGLVKGIDAPAIELEPVKDVDDLIGRVYTNHVYTEGDAPNLFWEELAANYLPCLFRTFFFPKTPHPLTDFGFATNIWIQYACWIEMAIETNSYPRFLRERPKEAIAQFSALNVMLSQIPQSELDTITLAGDPLLIRISDVHLALIGVLAPQLPLSRECPNAARYRRELAILCIEAATLLRSRITPTIKAHMKKEKNLERMDSAFAFLEFASEGDDIYAEKGRYDERAVYYWCQKYAGDPGPALICDLLPGCQMLACSRCKCVMYCGVAHQREDWKKHKVICFKPGWGKGSEVDGP